MNQTLKYYLEELKGSNHQLWVFGSLAMYCRTIEMIRQPSSVSSHDYATSLDYLLCVLVELFLLSLAAS
jgi:hypothetical protein